MKPFFLIAGVAAFIVIVQAAPAFALQAHGNPEGLYAHQLAHLFFTFCIGSFAYRIYRSSLPKDQGWQLIAMGSLLLMLWNLWAFAGHIVMLHIAEGSFILPENSVVPTLHVTSWKEILYYVLSMDHLLCVPALVCFYFGLRRILKTGQTQIASDRNK